ncbi:MAG: GTPase domain-containing protein, partial [Candidatus Thorarchaeota archaeon]
MELTEENIDSQSSSRPGFLEQIKQSRSIRKVLVAGSGAVGKTSLVRVLKESKSLQEQSNEDLEYHRTLFIDLEVVNASDLVSEEAEGLIQVVDIAGQLDLPIHAVRDAKRLTLGCVDVVILVFSADNLQSLLDLNEWLELLNTYYELDSVDVNPEYILVKNKTDQPNTIDQGLIDALLQDNSRLVEYFETSCLTGHGFERLRKWFFKRFFEPTREILPASTVEIPSILSSEFRCMICNDTVRFDIEDPSTYHSKTPHEKFFGMQLTTFRVSHTKGSESHQNVIIMDHKGLFRGHKDAYVESAKESEDLLERTFRVVPNGNVSQDRHPYINMILLLDTSQYWVRDILCPPEIRPGELAKLLMERIKESKKIYEKLPEYTTINVADREFHIWAREDKVVAIVVSDPNILTPLAAFARTLVESKELYGLSKKGVILLILKVLKKNISINPSHISRLLTDDLLYTKGRTEFQDHVSRIVDRI